MLNYKMNSSNSESFSGSLSNLIPDKILKLTLMENNLTDQTVSSIFDALSAIENGGLVSFSLIKNGAHNRSVYL